MKTRNKIGNKTRFVDKKHQNDIAAACKQKNNTIGSTLNQKQHAKNQSAMANVHVASTDDSKDETLCNFFSSVYNNEDDNPFKYLEKTEFISEWATFEVDDIRARLTQLNVDKSPGPDEIHPKILVETAHQISSINYLNVL